MVDKIIDNIWIIIILLWNCLNDYNYIVIIRCIIKFYIFIKCGYYLILIYIRNRYVCIEG